MHRFRPAALLTALALAACAESSPTSLMPDQPRFSSHKTGGGNTDTYPRAHLVWASQIIVDGATVAAGIQGDGRDVKGQPTGANEYQGEYCGVGAKIWSGERDSGDLVFDADLSYSSTMDGSCGGGRRYLNVELKGHPTEPGVRQAGTKTMMRELWKMAPDEVREQYMGFGHDMPADCQRLMFDRQYSGVNHVKITRLADVSGKRQWRVESQGTHEGACIVSGRGGKWEDTGIRVFAPFSVTVTEVPYPFPTYP